MTQIKIAQTHGRWDKEPRTIEVVITGEDINEVYAKVFREHDNRYKYCNSSFFKFHDEAHESAYYEWRKDPHNYASNGGDMW